MRIVSIVAVIVRIDHYALLIRNDTFIIFARDQECQFLRNQLSLNSIADNTITAQYADFSITDLLYESGILIQSFSSICNESSLNISRNSTFSSCYRSSNFFHITDKFATFIIEIRNQNSSILNRVCKFKRSSNQD